MDFMVKQVQQNGPEILFKTFALGIGVFQNLLIVLPGGFVDEGDKMPVQFRSPGQILLLGRKQQVPDVDILAEKGVPEAFELPEIHKTFKPQIIPHIHMGTDLPNRLIVTRKFPVPFRIA
jgi:hypothetical protein